MLLPNAIILAFTKASILFPIRANFGKLEVSVEDQQIGFNCRWSARFSALSMLRSKKFQVFVSAILCKDEDELQKQFMTIQHKTSSKELIYELLPTVDGLPPRLSNEVSLQI